MTTNGSFIFSDTSFLLLNHNSFSLSSSFSAVLNLVAITKAYKSKHQTFKLEPKIDKKIIEQLSSYAKKMRKLGKTDKDIKASLLKVGWKKLDFRLISHYNVINY